MVRHGTSTSRHSRPGACRRLIRHVCAAPQGHASHPVIERLPVCRTFKDLKACGPATGTADKVRAGHQPQDRESARPDRLPIESGIHVMRNRKRSRRELLMTSTALAAGAMVMRPFDAFAQPGVAAEHGRNIGIADGCGRAANSAYRRSPSLRLSCFFCKDAAHREIYTLALDDAIPE